MCFTFKSSANIHILFIKTKYPQDFTPEDKKFMDVCFKLFELPKSLLFFNI